MQSLFSNSGVASIGLLGQARPDNHRDELCKASKSLKAASNSGSSFQQYTLQPFMTARATVKVVNSQDSNIVHKNEELQSWEDEGNMDTTFNNRDLSSQSKLNGGAKLFEKDGSEDFEKNVVERYGKEVEVASRAVQLGCMLSQRVQERILRKEEEANFKSDRSIVTVADWGVQAVIIWVLSQAFGAEEISVVAEEDTKTLKGMDGIYILQRVVQVVNECLSECAVVGVPPPKYPLGNLDVLKLINKGSAQGGSKGKFWVLDPVDGTLGFVRGDQYAVALAMVADGEVVLGVLGCPNFPMKKVWLNYHQRYYRLASKFHPPRADLWHKGFVLSAKQGTGQAWMEPLAWNLQQSHILNISKTVNVSLIDDPAEATFCEPVEKANSSHSFTAGVADNLGLRKRPLRVYSMAKYAAIARGDAEIFMKFAKAGYKEKIWDHAAGVLIVQEAGGVVTDAGGHPLDFSKGRFLEGLDRGIIATSGKKLHEKLLAAVEESWDSSSL